MGFFDKIKASVGIGGASIALRAPTVGTSNGDLPLKVTITGGKLDQQLNGVDLWMTLAVPEKRPDGSTGTKNVELWKHRIDSRCAIGKGAELRLEATAPMPAIQQLYVDQEDYLQFLQDYEELHWKGEGPLPFATYMFPEVTVGASADIRGAIDPSDTHPLEIVTEAEGKLFEVPAGGARSFASRLDGAYMVAIVKGREQWFAWWTLGMRTVAWADLQVIVSVRPEGVVRTYTNPDVPKSSVLGKLPGEIEERREGELDEAFGWAEALCKAAKLELLPRPVGNTVCGLKNLHILEGW